MLKRKCPGTVRHFSIGKIRAVVAITLLSAMGAASAAIVPVGEQITNGGFGTDGAPSLTGWTTGGTANARASTNAINGNGSIPIIFPSGAGDQHEVFDAGGGNILPLPNGIADLSYFTTEAFAVLGDTSGDIGGGPTTGTHTLSQTFTLPTLLGGQTVLSYDLTLSFKTAFDGFDADVLSLFAQDTFVVSLTGSGAPGTLFTDTFTISQINHNPFSLGSLSLAPGGLYTLTFTLNEINAPYIVVGDVTNTAAGIDNVSLTGTATVVPLPPALWLLGASLVALMGISRKRPLS